MKIFTLSVLAFLLFGVSLCLAQLLSENDAVSKLQAWQESHQRAEDQQSARIDKIADAATTFNAATGARLGVLETKITYIQASVSDLSGRLWALLAGTLALLINGVWGVIKDRIKRPSKT